MIDWKDVGALGLAGLVIVLLAGIAIYPNVFLQHKQLGYVPGTIDSFEFVAGPISARQFFDVILETGETIRIDAKSGASSLVPGDRVCIRARLRGEQLRGWLVPLDRCGTAD